MSATSSDRIRLNVGCGSQRPKGWCNCDSSLASLIQSIPFGLKLTSRLWSVQYESPARYLDLRFKWRIFDDSSCDVVYALHVFEHLNVTNASLFLREAHRVLRFGGVLRLVVPDLRIIAGQYLSNSESENESPAAAEHFLYQINLHRESTYGSGWIKYLLGMLQGFPHQHKYMYDSASLKKVVMAGGFCGVTFGSYGVSSRISDIEQLECTKEGVLSLYLEAEKPKDRAG